MILVGSSSAPHLLIPSLSYALLAYLVNLTIYFSLASSFFSSTSSSSLHRTVLVVPRPAEAIARVNGEIVLTRVKEGKRKTERKIYTHTRTHKHMDFIWGPTLVELSWPK